MADQNSNTQALHDAGVSLWLDDLSRGRIESGNLQQLIETRNISGVTTNPSIFAAALSQGTGYQEQIKQIASSDATLDEAVQQLTTADVRSACDIFRPVFDSTGGKDGWVSLEVDPRLARETQATIDEAESLAEQVGRENLLIKIPATTEGLGAITAVVAQGISVNVTLIFSLTRYREVINAWLRGLELAFEAGRDISAIRSVASFFVSRVDTEIDSRLDALSLDDQTRSRLKGKAGVANAQLAYQIFLDSLDTERWRLLADRGAHPQRPLWASTGTKNPDYPDTLYVTGLATENSVNTVPEKTLEATADHGVIDSAITVDPEAQNLIMDEIGNAGVDYQNVVEQLEAEGLQKFKDAWNQLLENLDAALNAAR